MTSKIQSPKLFISYSWSSPEYENRVVTLAEELVKNGVDVTLDKWDLKEGHDTHKFMEQAVSDPEIKKVAIFCDKSYAEKADARAGGVGKETYLISSEIYSRHDQNKFVAVILEKNDDGTPPVPTYYKGRIYIDLCEPDTESENFERLIRWIFDRPLYIKPQIGAVPSFLTDDNRAQSGTGATFRRCLDAIRNNKSFAYSSFDDYCRKFVDDLALFKIEKVDGKHLDDLVVESIEKLTPYRDEAAKIFIAVSQCNDSAKFVSRIHKLFEETLKYSKPNKSIGSWGKTDFDNYKFFINELFLYAVAIFIKQEKFEYAAYLFSTPYYFPEYAYARDDDVMQSHASFNEYPESLEHRNNRLSLRKLSIRAEMIKERCNIREITFTDLQQADLISYARHKIHPEAGYFRWYPDTLIYIRTHAEVAFEVFAKARSNKYFENIKTLLSITEKSEIDNFLESSPPLNFGSINSPNVKALIGQKTLDTTP